MISPSLTDLSAPGIIADCRAEYERAERDNAGIIAWATKWGRPLIEAIGNAPSEDDVAVAEQRARDAEETIRERERRIRDAADEAASLSKDIERLAKDLEDIA